MSTCMELRPYVKVLENGVGLTATNALSEMFEISSYRYKQMRTIRFKEGKKVSDDTIKTSKNEHGLQVAFKPSKLYLGSDLHLPVEEFKDWLQKLSYTVDSQRLRFKLTVSYIGKEATVTTVYKKSDIGGFLTKFSPESNLLKTPVVLKAKTTIMENEVPTKDEDGKLSLVDMERELSLDVVMNYDPESDETIVYSFCNDIETIEHGQHTTAVQNAILTFFRKKVKDTMSGNKKDMEVVNNDILFGLAMVVNLKTNYSRGLFTGQTKHKMDNKDLYDPIRKITLEALNDFFKLSENTKILARIIATIKDNIKVRLAATKAKQKTVAKRKSFIESQLITGYTAPNLIDREPNLKFELYVIEGDSAGTNAVIGRFDTDIQGALGLTGKPSQIYGMDEEDVAKRAPDMVKFFNEILCCGYGKNFNMDNLIYDKIILGPDADVDGNHICGIMFANIYKHARPLVEAGKVYRVKAPLYRLKELDMKKKDMQGHVKIDRDNYIYDKDEYFDRYEQNVSKRIRLAHKEGGTFITPKEMKEFLKTNRDYYELLDKTSKHRLIHPDLIEFIAMHPEDYKKIITKNFPEMHYDKANQLIIGSYQGEFYNILLDTIFDETIRDLTKVIRDGNDWVTHYHVYQKFQTKEQPQYIGYMSIGQIMALCQDSLTSLSSRYKGLGEMQPKEMADLVMNPHNRVLIRLTVESAEAMTEVLDDLFLDSHRGVRKQLVNDTEISPDDIDN